MHIPVLLNEVVDYLKPKEGDVVIDMTFGNGGYSMAICELIGDDGTVLGIDQDEERINAQESRTKSGKFGKCKIELIAENFRNVDEVAKKFGVEKVNGIVFDLGLNSEQLENSGRGFTFQKDEPLMMTFKAVPAGGLTAMEILNRWDEKSIADTLYEYGEEKFSRRIARKIVEVRKRTPVKTTFELVDLIRQSVPSFYRNSHRINCCTKTFQALRIAVNDELNALKEGLEKGWSLMGAEGRMAVVSFHSLEDRIVKNFFREKAAAGEAKILTKKPITPSENEARENPRSRSAKLRAIEKV